MPDFDIPTLMAPMYERLAASGFENTTAPTPDEWKRAEPGFQVRFLHSGRQTHLRYRRTPPTLPEGHRSTDELARQDRDHPWNEMFTRWTTEQDFKNWIVQAGGVIESQLRMAVIEYRPY